MFTIPVKRSRRSPVWGSSALGADRRAIRRPVGLRRPHPETWAVSVSWSSARWRLATGRERCSWDVFSFHDKAFALSFEHRKREGCAILVASCSGALCQPLLEKGLAKDQLLETEPDATRSGMAIETREPIPPACCRILSNAPANPRGEGYPCGS